MQPACIRERGRPEPWLFPAKSVDVRGVGEPGPGRPLPGIVRRVLQPFFKVDLRKVRVYQGIPEWLVKRSAVQNPAAMSYRYNIYVAPGYADLFKPSGWRTLIHELRHVEQFDREGSAMYTRYRGFTGQRGYWANPYEQDAYRFEKAVAAKLGL